MLIALLIPKKGKLHEPKTLFTDLKIDEITNIEYGHYKKLPGKRKPEIVFTTTHKQIDGEWYNKNDEKISNKNIKELILEKINNIKYVNTIYVESDSQLEKWQINKPNYIFKFNTKTLTKTLIVGTDKEQLGYYYVTKGQNPDKAVYVVEERLINSLKLSIERSIK